MSPKKILVTTATGVQGGGVVRHSLNEGHDVYALVRDPDSLAATSLSRLGAKLVHGSFQDHYSLATAVQGMDAIFLNVPGVDGVESDIDYAKNAIAAAKSASVSMLICSTSIRTGQHESFPRWGPNHPMYRYWLVKNEIESLVQSSGFEYWTIIRPSNFLQNLVPPRSRFCFPELENDGILRSAYETDARIGWVDGSDVGLVVAKALTNPEKYSSGFFDLVTESLTTKDLAVAMGRAMERDIAVKTLDHAGASDRGMITAAQVWASEVSTGPLPGSASADLPLTSVQEFFINTYRH